MTSGRLAVALLPCALRPSFSRAAALSCWPMGCLTRIQATTLPSKWVALAVRSKSGRRTTKSSTGWQSQLSRPRAAMVPSTAMAVPEAPSCFIRSAMLTPNWIVLRLPRRSEAKEATRSRMKMDAATEPLALSTTRMRTRLSSPTMD